MFSLVKKKIHLPSLKCPETMKMQPKHNAVCHILRWVTFVTHHSLVDVILLKSTHFSFGILCSGRVWQSFKTHGFLPERKVQNCIYLCTTYIHTGLQADLALVWLVTSVPAGNVDNCLDLPSWSKAIIHSCTSQLHSNQLILSWCLHMSTLWQKLKIVQMLINIFECWTEEHYKDYWKQYL